MHADPSPRTFIRVTVVEWDKWKKRVTRTRQRRYAIRIIKSRLTRAEGEESRVDAKLRITLRVTLHYKKNVSARKLISYY